MKDTRVYPYLEDLHTLLDHLEETDDDLSVTFVPTHVPHIGREILDCPLSQRVQFLRKRHILPYKVRYDFNWAGPQFSYIDHTGSIPLTTEQHVACHIQGITQIVQGGGHYFGVLLRAGKGMDIPPLKELSSTFIDGGYSICGLSVRLRQYRSAEYADLHDYSGYMHVFGEQISFEVSIPFSRQRQFVDIEVPRLR